MGERRTVRLLLRQWRDGDLEPFARLNADPETMRYFPAPLPREQSDELAERERARMAEHGWGLWAVEVVDGAPFIGFVGLARPRFEAHFTPAVEIGLRLAREHRGHGYATEAARVAAAFACDELRLKELVPFTSAINERSRRMMERLGMTHNPADDFEHPALPAGPLRLHVLYRLRRQ